MFAAVQSGEASYGVVPFENSSNGSVVFTLDLLADLQGRHQDLLVCGEAYVQVRHCLLGHVQTKSVNGAAASDQSTEDEPPTSKKAPAKPLHDISHVKEIYSHPQAWGQCKVFLSDHLRGIERQDVSSTSKAAELVAEDASGTSAAISSRMAADLNKLDVLAQGIEDNEGNSTRFFSLQRRERDQQTSDDDSATTDDELDYKTLVSFTVEHGEPGALADCLAVLKKHGLNLSSINSRPSGETPWHYIFLVEILGRKRCHDGGGKVNAALLELDQVAKSSRWLGSWANRLVR